MNARDVIKQLSERTAELPRIYGPETERLLRDCKIVIEEQEARLEQWKAFFTKIGGQYCERQLTHEELEMLKKPMTFNFESL